MAAMYSLTRDQPIMLIFYLLCYALVLKFLTYYAQYYANDFLTVLLKYIHLYHKNFKCDDCSIRVYIKFYTLTGAQIIILVDVLLKYIDLRSFFS